jgi:hypothetical protein
MILAATCHLRATDQQNVFLSIDRHRKEPRAIHAPGVSTCSWLLHCSLRAPRSALGFVVPGHLRNGLNSSKADADDATLIEPTHSWRQPDIFFAEQREAPAGEPATCIGETGQCGATNE